MVKSEHSNTLNREPIPYLKVLLTISVTLIAVGADDTGERSREIVREMNISY